MYVKGYPRVPYKYNSVFDLCFDLLRGDWMPSSLVEMRMTRWGSITSGMFLNCRGPVFDGNLLGPHAYIPE